MKLKMKNFPHLFRFIIVSPLRLVCLYLLLFSLFVWTGCSSSVKPEPESEGLFSAQKAPVELAILDSRTSEEILNVEFSLKSLTAISSEEIAIQLDGLKQGDVVLSNVAPASSFGSASVLEAGDIVTGSLSLDAKGLDEYSVRVAWGVNAQSLLSVEENLNRAIERPQESSLPEDMSTGFATQPIGEQEAQSEELADQVDETESVFPAVRALEISRTSNKRLVLNCPEEPCPYFYVLKGELLNKGTEAIGDIELAVGLFWKASGKELELPKANQAKQVVEEVISLGQEVLEPGQKKILRIKVDRALPTIPGGEFVPHVRVLRASLSKDLENLSDRTSSSLAPEQKQTAPEALGE